MKIYEAKHIHWTLVSQKTCSVFRCNFANLSCAATVVNLKIFENFLVFVISLSVAESDFGVNLLGRPLLGRLTAVWNDFHL